MGIFRRIIRRAREGFPIIGAVVKKVVVGTAAAKPVTQSVEASIGVPALALIRKAAAAIVGYITGALLVNWFGIDLGFLSHEMTELLVSAIVGAYLTWRVPNAPVEATR